MNFGLTKPSNDFNSVRDRIFSQAAHYDFDCSFAVSENDAKILFVAGNMLYNDASPDGAIVSVKFQDTPNDNSAPWVTLLPGMAWKTPFTQIKIKNLAQSLKTARLIYGVDIEGMIGAPALNYEVMAVPTPDQVLTAPVSTGVAVNIATPQSRYILIQNQGTVPLKFGFAYMSFLLLPGESYEYRGPPIGSYCYAISSSATVPCNFASFQYI